MGTMLEYLDWRGDLKFEKDPFNDVDNQLCAQLSFIGYKGLVSEKPGEEVDMAEAIAAFFDIHRGKELSLGVIIPSAIFEMARKMAVAPRFGETRLTAYRNEINEDAQNSSNQLQWAALTMLFEDETMYISFSGTDDTLVSWKEDMNMAVFPEVPSQKEAAEYVNAVMAAYPNRKARIGGHSKGGNLALFAAAKCKEEFQDRITVVYDNDGPGFSEEFLRDKGYLRIKGRVRNIVPEESFVGLLLCHDLPQIVVKSSGKNIFQHDSFSWIVTRNRFELADCIADEALLVEKTVKNWLSEMSIEQKNDFFDALYRILTSSDAKTLTELIGEKRELLKAYRLLNPENRAVVKETLKKLLGEGRKVYTEVLPAVLEEKMNENKEKKAQTKKYVTCVYGSSLYDRKKTIKIKRKR